MKTLKKKKKVNEIMFGFSIKTAKFSKNFLIGIFAEIRTKHHRITRKTFGI